MIPNAQLAEDFMQYLQNLQGGQEEQIQNSDDGSGRSADSSHYESPRTHSSDGHSSHSNESLSSSTRATAHPNTSLRDPDNSDALRPSSSIESTHSRASSQQAGLRRRTATSSSSSDSSPASKGEEGQDDPADRTLISQPDPGAVWQPAELQLQREPRAELQPEEVPEDQGQVGGQRQKQDAPVISVKIGNPSALIKDATGSTDVMQPSHLPSVGPRGQILEQGKASTRSTSDSIPPKVCPP